MRRIIILLMLVTNTIGCEKPIVKHDNLLSSLSEQWEVEFASLDNIPIEDWNQMAMTIDLEEDSLTVDCVNQPNGKRRIWPNTSKWFYIPISETTHGEFIRNDSIDLNVSLKEGKLHINFHPPREWSYSEECPNDNYELICSEEGQWSFVLIKI